MFKYNESKEIEAFDKIVSKIENEVIKNKVKNIVEWNVHRAYFYKYMYYSFSIILITLNASIPVINQIGFTNFPIVVSIVSMVATIITSVLTLVSVKDNWYRYRKYAELIKSEVFLYVNMCRDYSCEKDRNCNFVNNIENILSDERIHWGNKFDESSRKKDSEGEEDK